MNLNWDKKGYHLQITHWEGRLGNNIQQLCCAIFIAEHTESVVTYPEHTILLHKKFDFTIGSAHLSLGGLFSESKQSPGSVWESQLPTLRASAELIVQNTFFDYAKVCGRFLSLYNFTEQRRICEKYINPLLQPHLKNFKIIPNDTDLIIHIRSGDAFIGRSHPLYVEEPLSYYKVVINKYYSEHKHKKFRIIIVTEPDLKNPCIKGIVNYVEYLNLLYAQSHILECVDDIIEYIVDTDLTTAIQLLMTGKILVLANSSFSQRLALCNTTVKNIYCSNLSIVEKYGKHNDNSEINYHFHKIKNYIDFGEWKNTQEQTQLMMTHPISDIQQVTGLVLPAHFTKNNTSDKEGLTEPNVNKLIYRQCLYFNPNACNSKIITCGYCGINYYDKQHCNLGCGMCPDRNCKNACNHFQGNIMGCHICGSSGIYHHYVN